MKTENMHDYIFFRGDLFEVFYNENKDLSDFRKVKTIRKPKYNPSLDYIDSHLEYEAFSAFDDESAILIAEVGD